MIILGIVLLVLGLLFHIGILWTIGIVIGAIGVVLLLVSAVSGTAVGGRRYWF